MTDKDAAAPETTGPRRNFYGRRQGRPLRENRKKLMETLLPSITVAVRPNETIDPAALFTSPKDEYWLEIGFGGGEHLAAQAKANPQAGLIGCEIFLNGIASALSHIDADKLDNVRIYPEDVRDLLPALKPQSFTKIFLLFPDPWHKARHAGRRFVNQANLDIVANLLKPGGEFRIGSDDPVYIGWSLAHTTRHKAFQWLATSAADWAIRPDDWPASRYEQKAIRQGRVPHYFRFKRV
ncbi:tRNA (guanosine(46)-N7)-methyltransferase TrmB [Dongia rigui]|uniref:tRNA (guanine-N(7)-)-methyltransferase n=1 Tax=Dongia rigui TaxID=940149 RepID=A0ABU5DWV5_9PROT|nr:tRNA (guanosine(46)-N7)-methyltransferase TrmB [Dongia rigui]MDY0871793.1 tRNA (guanosine(46)-N7)-methyltransferase TrmB [Dongia rigui]